MVKLPKHPFCQEIVCVQYKVPSTNLLEIQFLKQEFKFVRFLFEKISSCPMRRTRQKVPMDLHRIAGSEP